jgi:oxygen-dependent protoporphyrinogen oxidase
MDNGRQISADAVIVASPHKSIAAMFENREEFSYLKSMESTSVANVALGFSNDAVEMKQEGTGFVISRNSDFTITACTWTNKKWPHTAPEGKTLLRAYVGKAGDETVVDQSDNEIVRIVLDDLKRIMKITGEPEMVSVTRWNESMPQYNVGHKQKIKELFDTISSSFPGIFPAGASFEGVGIPDCISQGKQAVYDMIDYLQEANG